jgi:eukaryotic-like serine/threonine-protein kinase
MTHGGYGGGSGLPAGGDPFGDDPFTGDPFAVGPAAPTAPGGSAGSTPQQQSQEETNTLATLSVVFAFVFAPAGAILGHLALSQIHESGERGRDRALVGITLSYVFTTVAVVALVVWSAGGNGG